MTLPPRLQHLSKVAEEGPQASIYVLLDPKDGKPRWLGCSLDPRARASQHWHDAKYGYTRSNKHLYEWLLSLSAPPDYEVLAKVPVQDRWKAELEWTNRLLEGRSCKIFNIRKGKSVYR